MFLVEGRKIGGLRNIKSWVKNEVGAILEPNFDSKEKTMSSLLAQSRYKPKKSLVIHNMYVWLP